MKPISPRIILYNLLYYWFPTIGWALVIFYFSSLSVIKTSDFYWQDFLFKKTAHFVEYAILSILLYRSLLNSGVVKKNAIISSLFLSIIYAVTDELHQSFTPGREPRIRDIVIDITGAGLAMGYVWKYLPKSPKSIQYVLRKLGVIL